MNIEEQRHAHGQLIIIKQDKLSASENEPRSALQCSTNVVHMITQSSKFEF